MEQQQIFKMKYPTWTKILSSFGDEEINCALAKFLVLIIEHTEGLFKLAPERQPEDYDETVDGEIDSQLFPNFPILRQRAYYEKECQAEDDKSLKSMCEKKFPNPFRSFSWHLSPNVSTSVTIFGPAEVRHTTMGTLSGL